MRSPAHTAAELGKDAALSADIHLLGRILGDVVREQAGDEVFDLVEAVRRRAVDARRGGRSPLDSLADSLPHRPIDAATASDPGVRLAVPARQHRRGRAPRTASPLPPRSTGRSRSSAASPRPSTTSNAPGSIGDAVGRLIDDLVVTPVITAHPTEVRRQTVLDVLAEVARLLAARTGLDDDDPDRAGNDRQLELAVLTLWQTAEVRLSRLRVVDEINEALRYYPASLFDVVAAIEQHRRATRRRAMGARRSTPAG